MTNEYIRNGVGVTDPVLADSGATYTPGVSERRGGVTSYLHSGLKNADAQSGSSQTISASRKYDAWGNVRSSTGTWQGPFGHAGGFGYQSSDRSGLQLLGHRYYDPETGRFLTRDPIKDGLNYSVYGAGSSKPNLIVDVDGLSHSSVTTPAGASAAGNAIAIANGCDKARQALALAANGIRIGQALGELENCANNNEENKLIEQLAKELGLDPKDKKTWEQISREIHRDRKPGGENHTKDELREIIKFVADDIRSNSRRVFRVDAPGKTRKRR